jgi:hypothetical protein
LVLIALVALLISHSEKRWQEEGEEEMQVGGCLGISLREVVWKTWPGGQGHVGRIGVWRKGHAMRLSRSGKSPHKVLVSSRREKFSFYDKGIDGKFCISGGRKMDHE